MRLLNLIVANLGISFVILIGQIWTEYVLKKDDKIFLIINRIFSSIFTLSFHLQLQKRIANFAGNVYGQWQRWSAKEKRNDSFLLQLGSVLPWKEKVQNGV